MLCPDCGITMFGKTCTGCGHGKVAAGGKVVDSDWWRCADTKFAARCGKQGALSHSTQGGGPWYCRDHFSGAGKADGATAPPGGFKALRAFMPKVPEAA